VARIADPPSEATASPRLLVATLALVLFMAALDQTVVGTALPRIAADIGGLDWYAWVFTAYLVPIAAVTPVVGKLGDVYGRRRLLVVGIGEFVVSSALAGLAPSMEVLVIMRALQGVGAGMLTAGALAAVGDLFPPAQLGKYNGMMSGVYALASVVGPVLGGLVTDAVGWRWVFLINLPVGIVALWVVLRHFRPPARASARAREPLDLGGAVLLVATLVAALAVFGGLEHIGERSPVPTLAAALATVGLGVLFVRAERRAAAPILPLSLLANHELRVLLVVTFGSGMAIYVLAIFTPLMLQGSLGLSPSAAGLAMTPMVLGLVLGGVVGGIRLGRTGRYKQGIAAGLAIATLGAVALAWHASTPSVAGVSAWLAVVGLGIGSTLPLLTSAAQNAVEHAELGLATSLSKSARTFGGIVGLGVLGAALHLQMAARLRERMPALLGRVDETLTLALARDPSAILQGDPTHALAAHPAVVEDPQRLAAVLELLRESLATSTAGLSWVIAGLLLLAALSTLRLVGLPLRRDFGERPPAP
jgi:EmrB/QacA subfamily drug resistance transporter